MAATPSPSSSPNRASLDNLPTELLKHIVELVKQDMHSYNGLKRGSYRRQEVGTVEHSINDQLPSVQVVWSSWYGRELEALSRVNRRLRKLCMPHLVEEITYKQLAAPFGTYRLPQFAYTPYICSLTLGLSSDNATPYAEIAFLLPHLTGLDSLTVSSAMLIGLFKKQGIRPEPPARQEYTIEAFEALSTRLVRLKVDSMSSADYLGNILPQITSPSVLRHLELDGSLASLWYNEDSANSALRGYLLTLVALESLKIDQHGREDGAGPLFKVTQEWQDGWRMPSLRQFELRTYAAPYRVVPFLAQAMPNLERLSLDVVEPDHPALDWDQVAADVESVDWRHLRSFSMTGESTLFRPTLTSLSTCPKLRFVHLEPQDTYSSAPHELLPATFPPNLRRLIYHCSVGEYGEAEAHQPGVFAEYCTERGVALEWRIWQGMYSSYAWLKEQEALKWHTWVPQLDPECQGLKDYLQETLKWARRRLDHLLAVDDKAAIREMMTAIQPLEERRYIERGLLYIDPDASREDS
ncbi:hypothetical protein NBRC10512_007707 [Rhodotorula toruloides]|uniref:RHTO0S06e03444g1_1 n=2 Tax=Rhodotorula toruloides TaxID=5286 RepID=A0A061B3M3_RHOTO|nr:uncharacterized protein RHTO_06147 [Rhodotorula toruloides NP11]EMS24143.1 hypothetical protein RHTO_06147 [Rhodotorula toruloides NP11]CDR41607.1 RHTO0S06e03444g1_1 [Rhodotorula toruloides]